MKMYVFESMICQSITYNPGFVAFLEAKLSNEKDDLRHFSSIQQYPKTLSAGWSSFIWKKDKHALKYDCKPTIWHKNILKGAAL